MYLFTKTLCLDSIRFRNALSMGSACVSVSLSIEECIEQGETMPSSVPGNCTFLMLAPGKERKQGSFVSQTPYHFLVSPRDVFLQHCGCEVVAHKDEPAPERKGTGGTPHSTPD